MEMRSKKWGVGTGVSSLVLLLGSVLLSAEALAATLQTVDVTPLSGDRVKLTFRIDGDAPKADSFTINDPARVVIDFPEVQNAVTPRFRELKLGMLESISVSEAQNRTRATIKLTRMVPHSIEQDAGTVSVTLNATSPAAGTAAEPVKTSTRPGSQSSSDVAVNFRRGGSGQGVIVVKLPSAGTPVDVREQGGRIVADLGGVRLPIEQERRLDVVDFATPVRTVDVFNHSAGARLVVVTSGPREFLAYQADDQYTIEVRPIVPEATPSADTDFRRREFSGEPLSLNFQDIEVRAVLQILADFTGLNVVVSDTVQGSLTLRLKNVPWDQALDIILKTKGLSMRENGNVILIAPTEEIAAREKLELEAQRQTEELTPLRSELIQINFATASEIAELLQTSEASLLSDRGNVSIDNRTNTLLINDTPDKLLEIRELITRLDVPVRQVLIDSRVVIANNDYSKELGIQWGGVLRHSGTGARAGLAGTTQGAERDALNAANLSALPATAISDRIGVNLPTAGTPFGSLGLALLGPDYLLNLELSALQAEGRGEVLSNPRVVTTNRQQALIESGIEIPFEEKTSSGATSISFKKAVLALQVTPQITPNDQIIMDLKVNKDSEAGRLATAGGEQVIIATNNVETQVLVDHGETIVLGGIYERTQRNNVDKVPLLGDLPGIGALFRRTLRQDDKQELLIFVTPTILRETLSLQ